MVYSLLMKLVFLITVGELNCSKDGNCNLCTVEENWSYQWISNYINFFIKKIIFLFFFFFYNLLDKLFEVIIKKAIKYDNERVIETIEKSHVFGIIK